jgi:hypothetical protein
MSGTVIKFGGEEYTVISERSILTREVIEEDGKE